MTRRGNDWTKKFNPLVKPLAGLKLRSAMLDGEIVHLMPDGTSSFGALQEDLSEERPGRLCYFLFDLLALDGYVLTGCKLEDRKRLLEQIVDRAPKGPVRYSDHVIGHGPEFFAQACKARLEGIVSKRRYDLYLSARTRGWLKVKCTGREEFVILGWTDPRGSRRYFGSPLLGYYDAGASCTTPVALARVSRRRSCGTSTGRFSARAQDLAAHREGDGSASPPTLGRAKANR